MQLPEEVPDLDVVLAPDGSGLLRGTALPVAGLSSNARVMGGEPEGAADAYCSL